MALVIADRVRETSTTTGTGAVTLAGAYTSFQTFSAAIGNNNSTYYTIANAVTGEWEVGIGTYSSSGNTLSRDTVLASSNSGSLVNFTNGSKDVFVTQPAERSLLVQSAGSGLFTKGAAFTANGILYANATTTLTTSSNLVYDGSNMGLNATPSAWNAAYRALQLGVGASLVGATGASTAYATVGANWYASGSSTYNYLVTAPATYYTQNNGIHYWGVAASGTAGATVAFTAAMALDNSGNLGIGTTSPGYKLDVNGSANISGNITFSGGTANGVVYLNGSKQVTTGSALTFNGTNLGIGTTSAPLENGGGQVIYNATVPRLAFRNSTTGTTSNDGTDFAAVSSDFYVFNREAGAVIVGTAGLERLRIDSSGNLGLGVTPSAWVSPALPAFDIGVWGGIAGQTNAANLHITSNAYLGSGPAWKYKTSNYAGRFTVGNDSGTGGFTWFTAPSGTAGDPISFTQAMTLDASGNLGIGTSSPGYKLDVAGTGNFQGIQTSGSPSLSFGASKWMTQQETGVVRTYICGPNGSTYQPWEIYRATSAGSPLITASFDSSGNLGLGTSSPGVKLDVVGVVRGTFNSSWVDGSGSHGFEFRNAGTTTKSLVGGVDGVRGAYIQAVNFGTAYTDLMLQPNGGNLGLGVTPSAWTAYKAFQIGLDGSVFADSGSSEMTIGQNVRYDGSFKYITTQAAGRYRLYNGTHAWFNAPSGTAGDPISFTQAMTLDASGNLGLGETSPYSLANYGAMTIRGSVGGLTMYRSGATNIGYVGGNNSDELFISNLRSSGYITFGTNNTERARIDSSGNLRVNNSASLPAAHTTGNINCSNDISTGSFLIGVNNSFLGRQSSDGSTILNTGQANLIFSRGTYGSTSESARITSGGDLLVGTTNTIIWNTTNTGVAIGGSSAPAIQVTRSGDTTLLLNRLASDGSIQLFARQGTQVGDISVTTTATAYNTSSDYRLKDNQAPLTGSGAFIDALQPKTWTWKADGSKGVGFIAHEVQAVSPSTVSGTKDAVDEEGKPIMQTMEYGSAEFIANIIAELQSLRARVAALESKP